MFGDSEMGALEGCGSAMSVLGLERTVRRLQGSRLRRFAVRAHPPPPRDRARIRILESDKSAR